MDQGLTHAFALQALLDACNDAVILIDHRGTIETFNHAAEKLFGWPSAEVLGRNVSLLMPEPDRANHDEYVRHYVATREARVIGIGREVKARRRDGSEFPAALSIGMIGGTEPPRFVGFLRDLTTRHEVEAQRRRAEEAVRESRERLMHVARLSTMGELANGLAHELNQPLTAIVTFAQAAERIARDSGAVPAEVTGALTHISTQALRAGEVIRRLRALVRNRESRAELVAINQLVQDLTVLAEADARSSQVQLRTELGAGVPAVLADSVQLQQVMLNLIRNAIEAVQAAGTAQREVVLGTRRCESGEVEVSVSDQGPGIPAELRERIFEAFFTTKTEGTGLGLAISRTIIENHGGRLAGRDHQPRGSCFYFRLPGTKASV